MKIIVENNKPHLILENDLIIIKDKCLVDYTISFLGYGGFLPANEHKIRATINAVKFIWR